MSIRHMVIPVFIPHKGCPFDCIYCNQKTISGQQDDVTEEKMIASIEAHLSSAADNTYIEIGFYGGSFTGIEKEQQIRYLESANEYIKNGRVKGIRLSTRPDYINTEILDYLKFYNVKTIELGVQSLDEDVLLMSCRGHSAQDVLKSSELIKKYGIGLGIQTMIGLPGDSRNRDLATAGKVVEIRPDIVRIYPTLVIRNTYLEKQYREGAFQPLSVDAAVEICTELLDLYEKNNINVIRIGLQPTDTINNDMDVVAGPFHPAFRQLVESRLYFNKIVENIEQHGLQSEKAIAIHTGSSNISNIIGQKRENIKRLIAVYNFENVHVLAREELKGELIITPYVKI